MIYSKENPVQPTSETEYSLSPAEIDSIVTAVYYRFGYDYREFERQSLSRRLQRFMRIHKLTNAFVMWQRLLHDPEIIASFNAEISVGLTSFYRDPAVWKTLRILLMTMARKQTVLRIWHAGTSTGEEVYSMLLLLQFAHMHHKTFLNATDINFQFVKQAARGFFEANQVGEFRKKMEEAGMPESRLSSNYKIDEQGNVQFDKKLTKNTTFSQENLLNCKAASHAHYDMILCRNVMIYFKQQAKLSVLQFFCDQLRPGGFLVLGLFDSVLPDSLPKGLEIHNLSQRIYRKKQEA